MQQAQELICTSNPERLLDMWHVKRIHSRGTCVGDRLLALTSEAVYRIVLNEGDLKILRYKKIPISNITNVEKGHTGNHASHTQLVDKSIADGSVFRLIVTPPSNANVYKAWSVIFDLG